MEKIYLDHSATTPLDSDVLGEMMPYFIDNFGNPNSQHSYGAVTEEAVSASREAIAKCIKATSNEIYFTSGGTEADNWAIRGTVHAMKSKGRHIITSSIEHPAILTLCKQLCKEGFSVTYLPVDKDGLVSVSDFEKAIKEDTILATIMLANNEVGTIQPIKEMCEIAHKHNMMFHTDAVQAIGSIQVDVQDLGVDLMAFSAHKFYGPKGIGALYIKKGKRIEKLIQGGYQERKMRGGTTNVPSVVGMAKAMTKAVDELEQNAEYIKKLRDYFVSKLTSRIDNVIYNGHKEKRLVQNASISFRFVEGESILFSLDMYGIACSSGSACSSDSLEPSHVLLAMGIEQELAHGTIRFSFGKSNTIEQVDFVVDKLEETILKLRKLSPLCSGY